VSLNHVRRGYRAPNLNVLARSVAGLKGWRRSAVGFSAGAISVLGFAPLHAWPVLFITLPLFVWLLDGIATTSGEAGKPAWRQGAIAGWWFGFGFFVTGLYWVGFAFFVEADKFAVLAPLGVAAFPAALALFYALAAAIAVRFWRPGITRIFVFTATVFAAEWLRGHILTGFPWNLWGYAFGGNDALAQSASIFGVYGLTLLTLLIGASPAALAGPAPRNREGSGSRSWVLPLFCLALLAFGWSWGHLRLAGANDQTADDVRLRIVQGNIPQAEKWKPENREWIFDRLLSLSDPALTGDHNAPPTHIIWPETAIPVLFMLNDRIYANDVRDALAELVPRGASLIVGAERVEGTKRDDGQYNIDRIHNSLFILDSDAGVRDIYDKVHLVPFGEYLPLEGLLSSLGIRQLTHVNSGFAAGDRRPLMNASTAPPFVPLICYEAIFPGWLSANADRPGWLLNLTNDAWFGATSGPYQHLYQTRMRAIEEGIPLIRAANTGISAVIDPYGRILASLPLGEMGTLDHALPVALSPTPFARFQQLWLILLVAASFILYRLAIKVE